jgi:hypothetical protein
MPALPNLIVIGAAKCGTTSLAHYLSLHPEIQISDPKEVNYFTRSDWRDRENWYRLHFDSSFPCRGEASVSYTMFPEAMSRVPERMKELIPAAKLIYLVGDPLQRVISQWVMWHTKEQDRGFARSKDAGKPLAEVLDGDPLNPYVFPSRYASRLQQFLEHFPQEQILVVDQEELRSRPRESLSHAFSFLGVDESFVSDEFTRRLNQSRDWRRVSPGYARARRTLLAAGVERLSPRTRQAIGRPLRRLFSPSLQRPAADEVFDPALRSSLQAEADRLREITGMQFTSWSV